MAALAPRKIERESKEMSVVLGIDGGGTNTRAAIVADGKIVGSGQSGSIKRLRVGAEAGGSQSARRAERCLCAGRRERRPGRVVRRGQRHHARHHGVDHRGLQRFRRRALRSRRRRSHRARRGFSRRAGNPADRRNRLELPSAARPTAAANPPADGARASATKAPATGSACTAIRRALHAYDREEPCQVPTK